MFSYVIDETALKQAQLMDGKLMLVTNVKDLNPAQVVQRYKALADIERSFKVMINNAQPIEGISSINELQAQVLESLKIKKPTQDGQMILL